MCGAGGRFGPSCALFGSFGRPVGRVGRRRVGRGVPIAVRHIVVVWVIEDVPTPNGGTDGSRRPKPTVVVSMVYAGRRAKVRRRTRTMPTGASGRSRRTGIRYRGER